MMDNLRKTLGSFAMAALVFVGFIFIYNWSFSSFFTQLLLSHYDCMIGQNFKGKQNLDNCYNK
jgi:hypothetical protein